MSRDRDTDGSDHASDTRADAASPDGGVETADASTGTPPSGDGTTPATPEEEPASDRPADTASSAERGHEELDEPADDDGKQSIVAENERADATATAEETGDGVASTAVESSTDALAAEPRAGEVSLSTLFELLGNERRRHVIQVLRQRESVGLAELAETVAAREHGVDPDTLTRRQQRTTYSALQQTHLPKMDDAAVLSFDKSESRVTAGEGIAEYTMYLDVVPSNGLRRSGLYLYLAEAGAVVAAGLWAGLPPFVWVTPLVWGGLLVVAVAAVAVVQLYYHPLFPERLSLG